MMNMEKVAKMKSEKCEVENDKKTERRTSKWS